MSHYTPLQKSVEYNRNKLYFCLHNKSLNSKCGEQGLTLNKKLFKPKSQNVKNVIQNITQNQNGKNAIPNLSQNQNAKFVSFLI